MTPYRPKVYTASKIHHAQFWRYLRGNNPQFEFTARWIDQKGEFEKTASPAEFGHCWMMDIQDVMRSEFLICYAGSFEEKPDVLRGALVEAGAMLAFGGTVLTVNLSTEHTWAWHPNVIRCRDTTEAFDILRRYLRTPVRDSSPENGA